MRPAAHKRVQLQPDAGGGAARRPCARARIGGIDYSRVRFSPRKLLSGLGESTNEKIIR